MKSFKWKVEFGKYSVINNYTKNKATLNHVDPIILDMGQGFKNFPSFIIFLRKTQQLMTSK